MIRSTLNRRRYVFEDCYDGRNHRWTHPYTGPDVKGCAVCGITYREIVAGIKMMEGEKDVDLRLATNAFERKHR